MVYRAIGLMSGSALEGLDIAFVEFHENSGTWEYTLHAAERYPYKKDWAEKLNNAASLNAGDYLELHAAYGRYTGEIVNRFIEANELQYKVQLISTHGHIVFDMSASLGDGASLAAVTGINVVSDLRAMNIALGGNGVLEDFLKLGIEGPILIALLGILRWREQNNVLAAQTGATRDSIGGAVWIGQDA